MVEAAASGQRGIEDRMAEALVLAKGSEPGLLDETLGLAALAGRFEPGDLASILGARHEPVRWLSEDHSLQPGTAPWARLGRGEQ